MAYNSFQEAALARPSYWESGPGGSMDGPSNDPNNLPHHFIESPAQLNTKHLSGSSQDYKERSRLIKLHVNGSLLSGFEHPQNVENPAQELSPPRMTTKINCKEQPGLIKLRENGPLLSNFEPLQNMEGPAQGLTTKIISPRLECPVAAYEQNVSSRYTIQ